jgi:hypothetical protein
MDDIFEITIEDLDIIKQLIEVTTKNGLILPSGLQAIGSLYNKIESIISNTESTSND